jgi:hypothetical protein
MKRDPPALLTTISMCSSWPMAAATAEPTSSFLVTSVGMTTALRPSAVMSAAVSASPASVRATSATSAPDAASATAIERPMPRDAPVTNAFRPVRSNRLTVSPPSRWAAARPGG